MTRSAFAANLKNRIELRYQTDGYRLGWRLLYSPEDVLDGAHVAFIGLNPGGSYHPEGHAEFAMERGSAYKLECWDAAPGQSKLQQQVLGLFERIGERPEAVLAGNLVPFRSPNWNVLPDRERALAFGKDIWKDILAEAKPQLVIGMGGQVVAALRDILHVRNMEQVNVNWGAVCGTRGKFANGTLVGIPHLSRFSIVTRNESQPGLKKLLGTHYRG